MRNVIVAVFVKSKPTLFQIDVTVQRVSQWNTLLGMSAEKRKKNEWSSSLFSPGRCFEREEK